MQAAHHARQGVVGRAGLDAALHGRDLHVLGAGLLCQLRVGLLQLEGPGSDTASSLGLPAPRPAATLPPGAGLLPVRTGLRAAWPQLTLLLALAARFLPETRLLRMRRKDWRSDFFSDFTRDSGPSMARESLG